MFRFDLGRLSRVWTAASNRAYIMLPGQQSMDTYLTLYPKIKTTHAGENKHYSRHRKHSVKLCTIGSKTFCPPLVRGKTTNRNQNYRSAERVYNL